jgi:2-C-methyl-D-erythritol 4-phosphate cytidylyltransferase
MQIAIILAAGNSQRMRSFSGHQINKIFYPIFGRPLIYYTILPFEKSKKIQKIIVVTKEEYFSKFLSLISKYRFKKIVALVKGGKERQISAFLGLNFLEKVGAQKGDLVLFHNGANPLVTKNEIEEIIAAGKKYKCALLAQMAKDTIKKVSKEGFVLKTLNRKEIFLAQTPQVIEYELAKKAFEKAKRDKFLGTDDVSLVERLGFKPKVLITSFKNIKVTYPEDLKVVKSFLR